MTGLNSRGVATVEVRIFIPPSVNKAKDRNKITNSITYFMHFTLNKKHTFKLLEEKLLRCSD